MIIISKKSQLLRWSKLDNRLNKLSKFLLNGTNNEAQTENSCLKIVSITPFFLSKNLRSLCSPAIILFRTFFYDIAKALSNPWNQLIVWWIRIINLNWRLANCQRTVCADDHAHFFVKRHLKGVIIFEDYLCDDRNSHIWFSNIHSHLFITSSVYYEPK